MANVLLLRLVHLGITEELIGMLQFTLAGNWVHNVQHITMQNDCTHKVEQARSQDQIWRGGETPNSGPFGPKKWDFLNLTTSTFLQNKTKTKKKKHIRPSLCLKVDLLADLGWYIIPPPGYGPEMESARKVANDIYSGA